jgi:hypothetical protein
MRRLIIGGILGILVVLAGFWGYATVFSHKQQIIQQDLTGPFKHEQGHCWVVELPALARWADSQPQPENSTLLIYEDGRPLGPAHAQHDNIRKMGQGRFSHWGEALYFSANDNSDPNTNGKHYTITASPVSYYLNITRELSLFSLGFIVTGGVVGLILLALFPAGSKIRIWLVVFACINAGVLYFLSLNPVHPLILSGKLIYVALFLLYLVSFASLFLISHEIKTSRPKRGWRRLVFTTCSLWGILGIFVVLFEIFFRIIPVYDTLSLNPGVKFFWPDYVYFPLNAMGYRERPFTPKENPHTFRILVVGDSFVEGSGCRREETFSAVLERELNRRFKEAGCPARVEVFNLGRCGANTVEEVHRIVKESPLLQPDLIILAYVLNDPENHPPDIKFFDPPPWASAIHKIFLEEVKSYAYYWFFTKFTLFRGEVLTPNEYLMAVHEENYHGLRKAKESLVQLKNFVKEKNIDFFTIIFPIFYQGDYPDKLKSIHRQVFQMIQGYDMEVFDLLDFYEKQNKNLGVFAFSAYDSHPNLAAHNLLGKYLAESIGKRESFVRAWENCGSGVVVK